MHQYIVQRLLLALPTLLLITILTFVGLRVIMPADVIDLIIGEYGGNDPGIRAELERQLGISGSMPRQYADWMGFSWFTGGERGILQGDLGDSLHSGRAITSEVARRLPVSVELGLWGQMSAIVFAIPLGVWAALRQDKWPDYGLRSVAILLSAVPNFWIAILVITFASLWVNWAPPVSFSQLHEDPIAHLRIMFLPALIIGLTPSGWLIRLVRTQMLEILRQDFIRTAHAKGLSQNTVLYKHALRNALLPVVTVVGVGLPAIVSGTVIFEQIFNIPGMGRYFISAVANLDYPVVQGLTVVFASLLVVCVIIVDLSYALLDPRIRYR